VLQVSSDTRTLSLHGEVCVDISWPTSIHVGNVVLLIHVMKQVLICSLEQNRSASFVLFALDCMPILKCQLTVFVLCRLIPIPCVSFPLASPSKHCNPAMGEPRFSVSSVALTSLAQAAGDFVILREEVLQVTSAHYLFA
jgi:hypothetical protein